MLRNKAYFSISILQIAGILLLFISFCLVYSCSKSGENENESGLIGQSPGDHSFIGDQTCQSCHAQEWDEWKGSHHDYAIAEADEESVRGDFENVQFSQGENRYRFYRDEENYMVDVTEQDQTTVYRIDYTFGWEPLQQYLIDIGQGKMQALHIAWDTERGRWFSLQPDEEYEPDDWMHWTGGAMNWNTMCADCHSTNLKQNYIAEADSFHTTWSVLNVSCEACHGPGKDHVEFMKSPEAEQASGERIRSDLDLARFTSQANEINTCAPCHSLRQQLTDEYVHGDNYLDHFDPLLPHPDNYFADGQIWEEVYVYGSFLQSKMYAHDVQCSDCHNPHSLELKESLVDNKLCMSCHEPVYNTPDHHFHEANTESSQCVNCHMTGRLYMEVDYGRDHSFRVPRPGQTAQFGTPNACNDCHSNQTPEWASLAIDEWYGEDRLPHFSETLLKANESDREILPKLGELIADTSQPEIIRATAVWYAGRFPDRQSRDHIEQALWSESALVRSSATKAMENLADEIRIPALTELLDDKSRSVRLPAVRGLAELTAADFDPAYKNHFNGALQEYKEYLEVNRYFPQGEMNRGQFYEAQGDVDRAMEAYQNALERDPQFNPARINLAYLFNSLGENSRAEELLREVIDQEPEFGQAYYSLGLLLAEENRLQEAVPFFEQASERLPLQSRIFYNLAIAYQTLGQPSKAEEAYLNAVDLEPRNGDFRYGLVTLYMQQDQYEDALEQAEELNRMMPNNAQVRQLLQVINQRLN
jgi:tetratricopeptide (TPR) repeat protein